MRRRTHDLDAELDDGTSTAEPDEVRSSSSSIVAAAVDQVSNSPSPLVLELVAYAAPLAADLVLAPTIAALASRRDDRRRRRPGHWLRRFAQLTERRFCAPNSR
jgi:hypothetical protein